jgi:hypothetical protein
VQQYQERVERASRLREDEASRTRSGFQPLAPQPRREQLQQQQQQVESQAPEGPPGPPPPPPPPPLLYQQNQQAPYMYQQAQPGPGWGQPDAGAPAWSQQSMPAQTWGQSAAYAAGMQPVTAAGDPAIFYRQETLARGVEAAEYVRFAKQQIPGIAHLPDALIASQSLDTLYRVAREERAASGVAAKTVEARAHQNTAKLVATPLEVQHGFDNRGAMMHAARILPGTTATLQAQWHMAQREWGPDGVDTLIGYDLKAIGYSGCVTAKGWDALHHPGSYEISLKMFSISNVARAAAGMKTLNALNEDGFVVTDAWKELQDVQEIKTALSNLCIAAQLAVPWNWSFRTLESYLRSTSNLDAELSGYKKAPILAAFIDHILQQNVTNWLQGSDFCDLAEIHEQWRSWWTGMRSAWRSEAAGGQGGQQGANGGQKQGGQGQGGGKNNRQKSRNRGAGNGGQGGQQSGNGGQGGAGGQSGSSGQQKGGGGALYVYPPNGKNLCKYYNEGSCSNPHGKCSYNNKFGQVKLYHLCSFLKKDGGKEELCLQKHPKVEHK